MKMVVFCFLFSCNFANFVEGHEAFNNRDWNNAIYHYLGAIQSGDLNEYEYVIAYWNIYNSYYNLGNYDEVAEALLGFIFHAEQVLGDIRWRRFLPKDGLDKIEENIWVARNMLDICWAKKVKTACRAEIFACFIKEISNISLFAKEIPFCGDRYKIRNISLNKKNNIIQAIVNCGDDGGEEYYFVVTGS